MPEMSWDGKVCSKCEYIFEDLSTVASQPIPSSGRVKPITRWFYNIYELRRSAADGCSVCMAVNVDLIGLVETVRNLERWSARLTCVTGAYATGNVLFLYPVEDPRPEAEEPPDNLAIATDIAIERIDGVWSLNALFLFFFGFSICTKQSS